jgi:TatD DNase family protein
MVQLIDIGINLMNRVFDADRETVLAEAEKVGVSPVIITGASERGSREALAYAQQHPGKCYTTAGVHPHDARNCGPATIATLRQLAGQSAVVAIGECGLDYNRDFSPRNVQREWFEKQLELAVELDMPLFLHERDAFEDFSALLNNAGVKKAVVHCFTGTRQELDRYLDRGYHIGITGWICDERRGRHLQDLVTHIPADRLMIETDAPYLIPRDAPRASRSGRNEARYLPHIANTIAYHQKKDYALLANETYHTTCRFFNLDVLPSAPL